MISFKSIRKRFISYSESRLRSRFKKKPNLRNRNKYITFLNDKDLDFPFGDKNASAAFIKSKAWGAEEFLLNPLAHQMTDYLIENIDNSTNDEWEAWIRIVAKTNKKITDSTVATALLKKVEKGLLGMLKKEEISFLQSVYSFVFLEAFGEIPAEHIKNNSREVLPYLIEFSSLHNKPKKEEIIDWVQKPFSEFYLKVFINQKSNESLENLMWFSTKFDVEFPIENNSMRKVLFTLKSWDFSTKYKDTIFSSIEGYLINSVKQTTNKEWKKWIDELELNNYEIDVSNSILSNALHAASGLGKFSQFNHNNYKFVLSFYENFYQDILEDVDDKDPDKTLPIILELVSIAQINGISDQALSIIRKWSEKVPPHPRSLSAMSNDLSFDARIKGPGSPHHITVTSFRSPKSSKPVRIVKSGICGDPTINAKVFSSLFSLALLSNEEPTFVLPGGAVLSFDVKEERAATEQGHYVENLFFPVLGPGGAALPNTAIPTIGVETPEALNLVYDSFQTIKNLTGCLSTKNWKIEDPNNLVQKIMKLMEDPDKGITILESDDSFSEGSSVIAAIPFFNRDDKGNIVPLQIEFDFILLGHQNFYSILTRARSSYISDLIEDAYRREKFAERAYESNDQSIKYWRSLSQAEKEMKRQANPYVIITQEVNFNLSIVVTLEKPREVDLFEYENRIRPSLRDSAKKSMEKYKRMQEKLRKINEPDGRADNLTLKLLIDSLIRQEPLSFGSENLDAEYKKWVELCSTPVWQKLRTEILKKGISPQLITADNILFNSSLDKERNVLIFQPWITIDMHDFVLKMNCKKGTIEAFPGRKTSSLNESVIEDSINDVINLSSLKTRFSDWLSTKIVMADVLKNSEEKFKNSVKDDPTFGTYLSLQNAKKTLFNGDINKGISILEKLRKKDKPAIYLWGSIAEQCKHVLSNPVAFNVEGISDEDLKMKLVNIGAHYVLQFIRKQDQVNRSQTDDLHALFFNNLMISNEAKHYLDQLKSCDLNYYNSLKSESLNIHEWELGSFQFSDSEKKKAHAAIHALSALELLDLAETLKSTAEGLPTSKTNTMFVKEALIPVKQKLASLQFEQHSSTKNVKEFIKVFG